MKPMRFGQRILGQYGSSITRMVGGDLSNVRFRFGDTGGNAATAANGMVTIGRDWWKGASAVDRRGALVHELTHLARGSSRPYDTSQEWGDRKEEQVADAVRFALVGERGGWTAMTESQRIARRRGWLGGGDVNQPGPRPGRSPGSRRNTGANAQSKAGAGVYAALAASQAQGYASQAAGLQSQYTKALMAIKQQRGQVLAEAKTSRAAVRDQALVDMSGAEAGAIANGIVGSSSDAINRAGVLESRGAGMAEVASAKGNALAELKLAKFGAQTDLNTGLADLQAQKAADLAELQVQRYQNELTAQSNFDFQQRYQSILRRLLAARGGGRGATGTAAAGAGQGGGVQPVSMSDFNGMQDGVLTPGERALIELKKGGR